MTLSILSRLVSLVVGATPPAPATAVPARQVFAYFHAAGAASVHGTISNLDGVVRSTWTVTRNGEKRTFDQPLGADGFRALLAGFSLPELRTFEVTRDDQRLDPVAYQIVSLLTLGDDHRIAARRTFLVPVSPVPRAVAEWLRTANVPPH